MRWPISSRSFWQLQSSLWMFLPLQLLLATLTPALLPHHLLPLPPPPVASWGRSRIYFLSAMTSASARMWSSATSAARISTWASTTSMSFLFPSLLLLMILSLHLPPLTEWPWRLPLAPMTSLAVSTRKMRKVRAARTTTSDCFFDTKLLLFPFFGVLMLKGENNLSIYVIFHFYLDLACKTIFWYVLVMWARVLKTFVMCL
jgi:hypothetical protein